MARPKTNTAEVRDRLIAVAVETLAEHGLAALSVRGVAQAAQTSTTAVYSLFGSKEALARAALTHAFEQFGRSQASAAADASPTETIDDLGTAYVQWALENPSLYELMFGRRTAGIESDEALEDAAARAIAPLTDGVRAGIASGLLRDEDPQTIVASMWSQVHGMTLLLLSGHWPDGADPVRAGAAIVAGWRSP